MSISFLKWLIVYMITSRGLCSHDSIEYNFSILPGENVISWGRRNIKLIFIHLTLIYPLSNVNKSIES